MLPINRNNNFITEIDCIINEERDYAPSVTGKEAAFGKFPRQATQREGAIERETLNAAKGQNKKQSERGRPTYHGIVSGFVREVAKGIQSLKAEKHFQKQSVSGLTENFFVFRELVTYRSHRGTKCLKEDDNPLRQVFEKGEAESRIRSATQQWLYIFLSESIRAAHRKLDDSYANTGNYDQERGKRKAESKVWIINRVVNELLRHGLNGWAVYSALKGISISTLR